MAASVKEVEGTVYRGFEGNYLNNEIIYIRVVIGGNIGIN